MHAVRQFLLVGLSGLFFIILTGTAAFGANTAFVPSDSKTSADFEGIVTLMDTNRGLLVLQERDHPMALKLDSIPQPPRPGERVQIEGRVSPYYPAFPDYPDKPSGREIAASFE